MQNSQGSVKMYNGQYVLKKRISQGSYGVVFEGEDIITKTPVAIKVEKKDKTQTLDREIHILTRLQGTQGVPKLYWSGEEHNSHVIVIQLLDKDLGAILKEYHKLSLKTVLMVLDQLLCVLRRIHNKSVVHRDLKPDNIMICGKCIYIVDFGISKLYRDNNQKHIPFKDNRPFVGTTRYASLAAHNGQELARKDDLESLLYIAIQMAKGSLPWQNMQGQSSQDKSRLVADKKQKIQTKDLCSDLPIEFAQALDYVKRLQFASEPDYEMLIQSFRKVSQKLNYQQDEIFDWNMKISSSRENSLSFQKVVTQVSQQLEPVKQPAKNNQRLSIQFQSGDQGSERNKDRIRGSIQWSNNPSLVNTYQLSSNQIEEQDPYFDLIVVEEEGTLFEKYRLLQDNQLIIKIQSVMRSY